jgi:hypothetical protein
MAYRVVGNKLRTLCGRQEILALLLLLFLALLFYRDLLRVPGILGHSWDWSVYPAGQRSKYAFPFLFPVWQEHNLGSITYARQPATFLLVYLQEYLGGKWGFAFVSKLWPLAISLLAGWGMFLCLKTLRFSRLNQDKSFYLAWWGSVLYGFSPYIFNALIAGAHTQLLAYALLPWCWFYFRVVSRRRAFRATTAAGAALLFSLLGFSIQFAFLAGLIFVSYFVLFRSRRLGWLFGVLLFLWGLNAYWLLPSWGLGEELGKVLQRNVAVDFPVFIHRSVPPTKALTLGTYLGRDMFLHVFSGTKATLWRVSVAAGWLSAFCLAFLAWLQRRGKKGMSQAQEGVLRKELCFWLLIAILLFALATGKHFPLGKVVTLLFTTSTFFAALFRDVTKVTGLLTFVVVWLLGNAVVHWWSRGRIMRKTITFLLPLFALVITAPFWSTGDLGTTALRAQKRDALGYFYDPPAYRKIYRRLRNLTRDGREPVRVLQLPPSRFLYFVPTEWQQSGHGVDSSRDLIPSFFAEPQLASAELGRWIGEKLSQGRLEETFALLQRWGVHYVIIRRDVRSEFSSPREAQAFRQVESKIRRHPAVELLEGDEWAALYRLKSPAPWLRLAPAVMYVPSLETSLRAGELLTFLARYPRYHFINLAEARKLASAGPILLPPSQWQYTSRSFVRLDRKGEWEGKFNFKIGGRENGKAELLLEFDKRRGFAGGELQWRGNLLWERYDFLRVKIFIPPHSLTRGAKMTLHLLTAAGQPVESIALPLQEGENDLKFDFSFSKNLGEVKQISLVLYNHAFRRRKNLLLFRGAEVGGIPRHELAFYPQEEAFETTLRGPLAGIYSVEVRGEFKAGWSAKPKLFLAGKETTLHWRGNGWVSNDSFELSRRGKLNLRLGRGWSRVEEVKLMPLPATAPIPPSARISFQRRQGGDFVAKLSPAEPGARFSGLVVLATGYHDQWRAEGITREGKKIQLTHLRVDGYANAWLLPSSPRVVSLRFYLLTQRYVKWGGYLSLLTLLSCFGVLLTGRFVRGFFARRAQIRKMLDVKAGLLR